MRRVVQFASGLITIGALAIVLYNATVVDRRPPTVVGISLSATAAGDAHTGLSLTAIDVEFSEPVQTATVESRFQIRPNVDGAFSWNGATTLIFTPSDRLPPETDFEVSIRAGFEDLAGNLASSGSDTFRFRTAGPPVVVSTEPKGDATGVAVDTLIKLTFDRLMDTQAVESALSVEPAWAYHASWSGTTLTLTPDAPLRFGMTYTLSVGTAAADTDGSKVAAPAVLNFTTVAAGLGVTATVPTANAAGVSVHSPIAVIFDAPIDPASVADALTILPGVPGNLQVLPMPDDSPASAASPTPSEPNGRVLLFTPSAALAAHTTYTVSLAPTVHPAGAPEQVARDQNWSFTTGQPTPSGQNQVVFLSRRGGVRNVWLMNPDGSNARQVTNELAPVSAYDVTGDGQHLLYASGGVVIEAALDGGNRHVLTSEGRFEYDPVLTPDGSAYLVGRRDATGADLGFWLVPLRGSPTAGERQLLPDGAPPTGSVGLVGDFGSPQWTPLAAFSADAKTLLAATASGVLELADLSGDQPVVMRLGIAAQSAPVWWVSSDGFIVAARDAGGTPGIYEVTRVGEVTRIADGQDSVAVASTGAMTTIAPASGSPLPGRAAHVAYATAPSFAASVLTTANDLADRTPTFAPDGSSILFVRVRTADPLRSAGIWRVGLDGRELRLLSDDGAYPRWLP